MAGFLFLTMFGMGATLTVGQFRAVLERPVPLVIGLASQFGWMPFIAYSLARALELPDALALGCVIMGCSSGGTTSNLFSYLSRADLALSISMTVVSTIAAVVMMPIVLWLWASPFTGSDLAIPYSNIITTLVAVLVPVAAGVAVRARSESAARKAERIGTTAGIAMVTIVILANLYTEGAKSLEFGWRAIVAGTALGPIGFALGYVGTRLLRLAPAQRRAIALETGIQNAPLALGIVVLSFSGALQEEILRVPLLYGVLVVPASAVLAFAFRGRALQPASPLET